MGNLNKTTAQIQATLDAPTIWTIDPVTGNSISPKTYIYLNPSLTGTLGIGALSTVGHSSVIIPSSGCIKINSLKFKVTAQISTVNVLFISSMTDWKNHTVLNVTKPVSAMDGIGNVTIDLSDIDVSIVKGCYVAIFSSDAKILFSSATNYVLNTIFFEAPVNASAYAYAVSITLSLTMQNALLGMKKNVDDVKGATLKSMNIYLNTTLTGTLAFNQVYAIGHESIKLIDPNIVSINTLQFKVISQISTVNVLFITSMIDWKNHTVLSVIKPVSTMDGSGNVAVDLSDIDVSLVKDCYVAVKDATGKIKYSASAAYTLNAILFDGAVTDAAPYTFGVSMSINYNIDKAQNKNSQLAERIQDVNIGPVIDLANSYVYLTPIHGQSLSLGIIRTQPALHATDNDYCYMFNTGVYAVGALLANITGIIPLKEGVNSLGTYTDYETSASGTADGVAIISEKDNIGWIKKTIRQVFLTAGKDGGNIASQFGTYYQTLKDSMTALKAIAPSFKSVKMPCCYWIQGEADSTNAMYKSLLLLFQSNLQSDALSILGQTEPIVMITYQTACINNKYLDSSKAQLELVRDNANFAPSAPIYIFDPQLDGVHINNWGQVLLGNYQGIAFYRSVIKGKKHKGVVPLTFNVVGNAIYILFTCDFAPLKFSTDRVTQAVNQGFEVINGSSVNIISSVELDSYNIVKITCTESPSGSLLRYAIQNNNTANRVSGNRGNLCDSMGDLYTTTIDGSVVRLDNYSFAFSTVL